MQVSYWTVVNSNVKTLETAKYNKINSLILNVPLGISTSAFSIISLLPIDLLLEELPGKNIYISSLLLRFGDF